MVTVRQVWKLTRNLFVRCCRRRSKKATIFDDASGSIGLNGFAGCCNAPASMMGRTETLQLMRRRGRPLSMVAVAALILAMAFVEHAMSKIYRSEKVKRSPKFSEALRLAEEHRLFPPDWLQARQAVESPKEPVCPPSEGRKRSWTPDSGFSTPKTLRVIMEVR